MFTLLLQKALWQQYAVRFLATLSPWLTRQDVDVADDFDVDVVVDANVVDDVDVDVDHVPPALGERDCGSG